MHQLLLSALLSLYQRRLRRTFESCRSRSQVTRSKLFTASTTPLLITPEQGDRGSWCSFTTLLFAPAFSTTLLALAPAPASAPASAPAPAPAPAPTPAARYLVASGQVPGEPRCSRAPRINIES